MRTGYRGLAQRAKQWPAKMEILLFRKSRQSVAESNPLPVCIEINVRNRGCFLNHAIRDFPGSGESWLRPTQKDPQFILKGLCEGVIGPENFLAVFVDPKNHAVGGLSGDKYFPESDLCCRLCAFSPLNDKIRDPLMPGAISGHLSEIV